MKNHWIALAVLAIVLSSAAALPAGEPKAGDQAPAFSMKGSDGKTHALADYKGKQVVVLAWFPKAFTGGCTKECKSMRENGKAIREYDVAYFTASVDDAETNAKFAKSLDLDYPILSDPTKKVAEAYGVVNPDRQVPFRWTFYIGEDGKILYVDKEVKAPEHGQDIAAKLKELGVEKKK